MCTLVTQAALTMLTDNRWGKFTASWWHFVRHRDYVCFAYIHMWMISLTDIADAVRKYIKNQKCVRESIARMSSKPLFRIQDDVNSQRQQLLQITSGLQRNAVAIEKLKRDTAQVMVVSGLMWNMRSSGQIANFCCCFFLYWDYIPCYWEYIVLLCKQDVSVCSAT